MTLLKKLLCVFLSIAMVLMGSGCSEIDQGGGEATPPVAIDQEAAPEDAVTQSLVSSLPTVQTEGIEFSQLSDPELLLYLEDAVYQQAIEAVDSDQYVVEDVQACYISKEYLDELAYNSQLNVFFGFTLDELESYFQGEKYVFTLGEDGHTVAVEPAGYEDPLLPVMKNVATGAGVILVLVTLSAVTGGVAPAASMVFAVAAKTGTIAALSSALISGVSAAAITGMQTGDFEESLLAGATYGSEGLKWGAVSGALAGGAREALGLFRATASGLTMNEAAIIQRESGLPLEVIRQLSSMEQYEILRDAGSAARMVNGRTALVREIDLTRVDEMGRTNLERMGQGLAPLDPDGIPYELHHIGQHQDSMLAILTREEHRGKGNFNIWHILTESEINRTEFDIQREAFWKAMAEALGLGL